MKTNYSIFTRVLVLAICFIMLVGGLTACFQEAAPENNVVINSTNNNGGNENGDNTENNGGELEVIPPPHVDDVLISTPVTPDAENKVPEGGVNMSGESASATVPGGVQMEEGATELALTINGIEQSEAQIELLENEVSTSFDVHVAGVAQGNLVPMEITLAKAVAKGLNSTSLKLYHVENGVTYEMTRIANNEAFTAHNQFKYDPATGDVTISIASFSEIALVVNELNAWKGKVDHTWYDANATELYIANADQLWSFSQIVGGMAEGIEQDSFENKTVTLLSDINLGDKESENKENIIFYPIGYHSNDGKYEKTGVAVTTGFYNFMGTFDGNGHTIANFYHNTWEMKGDHNWYAPEDQYYRDGMGLFGRVYKGTVKNLTVSNFSSDGEITTTGVIAAYADGATFENIAIFNCNPRVYNIGNGGIVGCVGWYAKEANLKTTFKNITVDSTNMISALWGTYDAACGGIVGQYYPTSGQSSAEYPVNAGISFENCHVSAIMDVNNDVCGNYQYYAYRYTGILIGSVRENVTIDGRVYPDMTGITATGCTVHYGAWNEYYYCELVANTLASYTHDHQFSRLTKIDSLDEINNGETWTKTGNFLLISGETKTCYHIVKDENGNLKQHLHEDAGEEIVDGETVLKEDKQIVYLPFNNLVTGYGWGVTSKGVQDVDGVTILDNLSGDSYVKFEGADDKPATLESGTTITLGELFKFVNNGPQLVPGAITVGVTNLDENGNVRAQIGAYTDDWTKRTITFTGKGEVQITIQDYYFCVPTTITLTINECTNHTYDNACDADCNVCGATRTPAEHEYETEVTAPTCTTDGYTTYTCTACGHSYVDDEVPAAHTPADAVKENEKASTCTEAGHYESVVKCSACGEELSRDTVALELAAHTAGETVVENADPATCTEDGSHDDVVYCSVCKTHEISRKTVTDKALGHNWNHSTHICSRCEKKAETKTIYFENNWAWKTPSVYMYYTGANGTVDFGAFPGTAMTKETNDGVFDVYKIVIPEYVTAIVFNDGTKAETAGHQQSVDLTYAKAQDGYIYSMLWDGDDNNKKDNLTSVKYVSGYKTIYFQNNWLWSDVKLNYLSSSANLTESRKEATHSVYTVNIPNFVTDFYIDGYKNDNSGTRDESPTTKLSNVSASGLYAMFYINGTNKMLSAKNIYLKTNNSGANWNQSGAWFAAWTWGGAQPDQWYVFEGTSETGVYRIVIPSDVTSMKVNRMASGATAPSWTQGDTGYWNQTGNISIPTDGKNLFTITQWNNQTTGWSKK